MVYIPKINATEIPGIIVSSLTPARRIINSNVSASVKSIADDLALIAEQALNSYSLEHKLNAAIYSLLLTFPSGEEKYGNNARFGSIWIQGFHNIRKGHSNLYDINFATSERAKELGITFLLKTIGVINMKESKYRLIESEKNYKEVITDTERVMQMIGLEKE